MQGYQVLTTPLALARQYLKQVVEAGDWTIDATVGKGRDLIFLAELVGETGKVFGFDIQEQALAYTGQALDQRELLDRVELIKDSHANLDKYVPKERIKAVMFNLGYLPGGEHEIITKPSSTVAALAKSLEILLPGGLITIVVYYGHAGGIEEKQAVEGFLAGLDPHLYSIVKTEFLNRPNNPPLLIVVEKKEEAGR